MKTIDICYRTGWASPLLHCSIDGEASWSSHEFKEFGSVELGGWRYVRVEVGEMIEFVCCNGEKTQWDKDQSEGYGTNYRIDIRKVAASSPGPPVGYRSMVDGGQLVELVYVLRNGKINVVSGSAILLVVDVDGTVVGDDEELSHFTENWETHQVFRGSKLAYNSGRNLKDFLTVAKEYNLPRPSMAILGAGTEAYDFPQVEKNEHSHLYLLKDDELHDKRFSSMQNFADSETTMGREDILNRDDVSAFPSWCPTRRHARIHKQWFNQLYSSWHREEAIKLATDQLPGAWVNGTPSYDPLRVSLSIAYDHLLEVFGDKLDPTRNENYHMLLAQNIIKAFPKNRLLISGKGKWRFLDILPMGGGKDAGTQIAADMLGFSKDHIVTAGDSGNDVGLFAAKANAICVGNADNDLIEFLKYKIPENMIAMMRSGNTVNGGASGQSSVSEATGGGSSPLSDSEDNGESDASSEDDQSDSDQFFEDSEEEFAYRQKKKNQIKAREAKVKSKKSEKSGAVEKVDNNAKTAKQQGSTVAGTVGGTSYKGTTEMTKTSLAAPNLTAAFAYLQGTLPTEQVYFANRIVAGGVLEGLEYYHFA